MALSGSFNTSSNSGRYLTFNWSATQSIADNTSTISWSLVGAGDGGWVQVSQCDVVIDGANVYSVGSDHHVQCYVGTVIASGSKTISHNSDGSRSFSASVSVGIYQWAANCSGSGTWTLNTIARASQPSCVTYPNNTQNVGNIGGTFTIHMNRKSTAFTHTVKYAFGNASGTIATGVGDNTTWTIPLNLANQVPNATSGTGTITVDTYNGGSKIGTKSVSFTCSVPSNMIPTVDSFNIAVDNSANSVIAGWGIYVAGYSKAKLTASASGSYGSSISNFTIGGGYSSSQTGTSLSWTGGTINSSGSVSFSCTAKDSRGRNSAAQNKSITVYAYSKPKVTSFSVARSATDATKMIVKANWTFASVNNNNTANAILYYKKSTASSWSTYGAIAKNTDMTLTTTFEEVHSYNFKVVVTDTVTNSAQEETFVSTIEVLLDFRAGGKGLGIGKIAETDAMEIALDTIFMGDVLIKSGNSTVSLATYIQNLINSN